MNHGDAAQSALKHLAIQCFFSKGTGPSIAVLMVGGTPEQRVIFPAGLKHLLVRNQNHL